MHSSCTHTVLKPLTCTSLLHTLSISHRSTLTAMLELPAPMHTASTTAQGLQLTDAGQHTVTPVHTCLNIPPLPPSLLHSGTALLPWKMWFVVFSSLLRRRTWGLWLNIISNSLLFSLLGPRGHQQLAESPVMEMLHTVPFEVFAKYIAGHFQC